MSNFISFFAQLRETPKEWIQAQTFLNWYLYELANFTNNKTNGLYSTEEIPSGKQFQITDVPAGRELIQTNTPFSVLRKVIDFGALPDNAQKTVAHGITPSPNANFRILNLYLAANNTSSFSYFSLQYFSLDTTDPIRLSMDSANVIVDTTNAAHTYSAYDKCYVIIEYVQEVN